MLSMVLGVIVHHAHHPLSCLLSKSLARGRCFCSTTMLIRHAYYDDDDDDDHDTTMTVTMATTMAIMMAINMTTTITHDASEVTDYNTMVSHGVSVLDCYRNPWPGAVGLQHNLSRSSKPLARGRCFLAQRYCSEMLSTMTMMATITIR